MILHASFDRLESLVINCLMNGNLQSFISQLSVLPRLYALTLIVEDDLITSGDFYLPIFSLPVLKYGKFSLHRNEEFVSYPITPNVEFSRIKHLNINLYCTLEILMNILSYTPRLCRLICQKLSKSHRTTAEMKPITLSNLRNISIKRL
jgi:hypothetical protein